MVRNPNANHSRQATRTCRPSTSASSATGPAAAAALGAAHSRRFRLRAAALPSCAFNPRARKRWLGSEPSGAAKIKIIEKLWICIFKEEEMQASQQVVAVRDPWRNDPEQAADPRSCA